MSVTKERLVSDLRRLGVSEGDHLNVKVSLKSIGFVEGGANTVIEALVEAVGPQGTFFTDAFVSGYPLPLSEEGKTKVVNSETPSYAGALANAMVRYPGSFRSPHPIQKFVGIGALAEELTSQHDVESSAYGLLGKLTKLGGKNLKIGEDEKVPGVGTTHVVIEEIGLKRKRRPQGVMFEKKDGTVDFFEIFWTGGCSHAWLKFYPEYRKIGAIIGDDKIGDAPSKLTDMQKTYDWELEAIAKNSSLLLCDRKHCRICSVEWDFATRGYLKWKIASLLHMRKLKKKG